MILSDKNRLALLYTLKGKTARFFFRHFIFFCRLHRPISSVEGSDYLIAFLPGSMQYTGKAS